MDQDEASIAIWERVDDGKKPRCELYKGAFYNELATIKFKQIKNIDSTRKNWQFLTSTINDSPGIIEFKAYRAVTTGNGDFLMTVFERYQETVATLTVKKVANGQRWGEAQLIRTLLELTRAGETLNPLNVSRICPERLLVTLEGAVKFPVSIKKSQSKTKYPVYLPPGQSRALPGPYALGATLLSMCLCQIPDLRTGSWIDFLPRVSEEYPILVPLLSKYLDLDPNQQYDFSHMLLALDVPICFAAIRLNSLIQRKEVKRQQAEVRMLLSENRALGETVTPEQVNRPESGLVCKSCLKLGSAGIVCECGAVNFP